MKGEGQGGGGGIKLVTPKAGGGKDDRGEGVWVGGGKEAGWGRTTRERVCG